MISNEYRFKLSQNLLQYEIHIILIIKETIAFRKHDLQSISTSAVKITSSYSNIELLNTFC